MKKDIVDFVYDWIENYSSEEESEFGHIRPQTLKILKDRLLEFDIFKNVKTLNIVTTPIVPMYQGIPVECIENYLGGVDENSVTASVIHKKGDESLFGEVVDLYMINTPPKKYDLLECEKPGVWRKPITWTKENSLNSIVINWDANEVGLSKDDKSINKRILDEVEKLLNSNEVNIPFSKDSIMLRVTKRSLHAKK